MGDVLSEHSSQNGSLDAEHGDFAILGNIANCGLCISSNIAGSTIAWRQARDSMPIDFSSIRAHRNSQQDGFEELVCQIARRTIAAGNETWRRLDGAGGDGGVEAYFLGEEGKTGLQAKYFTHSRDVSWGQIWEFFRTALNIHSDLVAYRVSIACDLTGPTGRGGRTGVDQWDETHSQMEADANARGLSVCITLETASDLIGALTRPECVGLQEYWFNVIEITPTRLQDWLSSAIHALGERFHPEDHVEVAAQDVLRTLSHSPSTDERVRTLVRDMIRLSPVSLPKSWADRREERSKAEELNAACMGLNEIVKTIDTMTLPWPILDWRILVGNIERLIGDLRRKAYEFTVANQSEDGIPYFRHALNELYKAIATLELLFSSKPFNAEIARGAIYVGSAGSGKSHLLSRRREGDHKRRRRLPSATWTQVSK